MELKYYFDPVNPENFDNCHDDLMLGRNITINTENNFIDKISDFDIALIGIPEDRNSSNQGCSEAPDKVRSKLYELYKSQKTIKICDLGNLKISNTINDTYFAIRDICIELLSKNTLPIIIGGTQDLTYASFLAYDTIKQSTNIVAIDSRLDIGNAEEDFDSTSYLSKIVLLKSNYLQNFTNIGYQTYLVSPKDIDLMDNLQFDAVRLGEVRSNIKDVEPVLRDANIVSFDISAIKQSDATGQKFPSPNGLTGDEACQIARYAGLSNKLSCFGVFEINPSFDQASQTVHLAAQMIWYFIEGFYHKKNDTPYKNSKEHTKYIVNITDTDHNIYFYKSNKTNRWWLEVQSLASNDEKKMLISCSYEDYVSATRQEIPERWWKYFQKLI